MKNKEMLWTIIVLISLLFILVCAIGILAAKVNQQLEFNRINCTEKCKQ